MGEERTGFFAELKRRNVIRVALLYLVTSWVVFEVAAGLLPVFAVPDWVLRAVVLLLLLGFIPTLVFSWAYEITPEGIRKESEIDRAQSVSGHTARNVDRLTVALLAVLVAIVAVDRLVLDDDAASADMTPLGDDAATAQPDPITQQPAPTDSPGSLPRLTIAVLPFVSRSEESGTSIFADGIHDDLLTVLANIGSLRVISRTSVMEYRDTIKNIRSIGQELGAGTILEGGVQQVGSNVRINVQLISAETDEHLWARTFDRDLTTANIFAIQSDIAEAIATQLAATLSPMEKSRINRQPTDSLEAYSAYVRGRQHFVHQDFESLRASAAEFRQAIRLDPDYVDARIGLARSLSQLAHTGAIRNEDMLRDGSAHIEHALRLDPTNGYAWAVQGVYQFVAGSDQADKSFEKAMSLSPNSPDALETHAEILRRRQQPARALPIVHKALQLDPLSVGLHHDLGFIQMALGNIEAANAAFSRIEELDPGNPYAAHGQSSTNAATGQVVEAAYWSDRAWATDPVDYENPASSALFFFDAGYPDIARQRLQASLELGPGQSYPMGVNTYFLAMTGNLDQALASARSTLVSNVDDRWGSHYYFLRVIRDQALRSGDHGESLGWYRRLTPELFEDPPRIDGGNIRKAADLGHLMLAAGQESGADLLSLVIQRYDEIYTRGSANYPLGVAKAAALMALGRPHEALQSLRFAVDDGWRILWRWELQGNPSFEPLHGNPELESLIAVIESDLAEQRAAFEASGREFTVPDFRSNGSP